jgi:nickel-dependent lactate racemase
MRVKLAYGRAGLEVNMPDTADVIEPQFVQGLTNEAEAILDALRSPIASPPLNALVAHGHTVAIVHTDITRATPNDRMLPILLKELEDAGIRREDITLINGLGTHRKQTDAELRAMLGTEIVDHYRCIQHDCYDDANLVTLGVTSRGNPVRINKTFLDSDIRILTGFIEPHFFAGFSGGPKAVLPSLAGWESVFSNHGAGMISHPNAMWGITEGNPIWEEMSEVALRTRPTFTLMVTMNRDKQMTGIFAGDMLEAHRAGREFVRSTAMAGVEAPYDLVITTNSGYPLDQNLYQAVKGMSGASQIVRDGGEIIIAAACEDGLPDHGGYVNLLEAAGSPKRFLEMLAEPGFHRPDQWQVQIQAQIQLKANVSVYSDHLSDEDIRRAWFAPCRSIEARIAELREQLGPLMRMCVIPEGPQTIAYLRQSERMTR